MQEGGGRKEEGGGRREEGGVIRHRNIGCPEVKDRDFEVLVDDVAGSEMSARPYDEDGDEYRAGAGAERGDGEVVQVPPVELALQILRGCNGPRGAHSSLPRLRVLSLLVSVSHHHRSHLAVRARGTRRGARVSNRTGPLLPASVVYCQLQLSSVNSKETNLTKVAYEYRDDTWQDFGHTAVRGPCIQQCRARPRVADERCPPRRTSRRAGDPPCAGPPITRTSREGWEGELGRFAELVIIS